MSESRHESQPSELLQAIAAIADSPFAARGMYNDKLHVFCHAKAVAGDEGSEWNVRVIKIEDVPGAVDDYAVNLSRPQEVYQIKCNSRDPEMSELSADYDKAGLCAVLQRAVVDEELSRKYQQQAAPIVDFL